MNVIPFLLPKTPAELFRALESADKSGDDWPAPGWLRANNPRAMRGVRTGWQTWQDPEPAGALVLASDEEQRVACGNRWFLLP